MSIFGPGRPGETPIPDRSGLRDQSIRTRNERDTAEFKNIESVVLKYLAKKPSHRLAPFDYSWSLKLHREMFGKVWSWAGQPRQSDLNLGLPWTLVPQQLGGLFLDLDYWPTDDQHILESAARLHHRAVSIHPFLNGNGRWGRMLASIYLKKHGYSAGLWPEVGVIDGASSIRTEYIDALRHADQGNLSPLIELHRVHWNV